MFNFTLGKTKHKFIRCLLGTLQLEETAFGCWLLTGEQPCFLSSVDGIYAMHYKDKQRG